MASIRQFEDLVCWQRSRELVKLVYSALNSSKDFGFKDQIQRASVSVMSNIAEGFESGTRNEFIHYLYISKASAGEVRAQLYIALECSRLISGFINSLKKSNLQGLQRKTL
jgi:four helix bundle protein